MKDQELSPLSTQHIAASGTFKLVLKKDDQIIYENSTFETINWPRPYHLAGVENGANWIEIYTEELTPFEPGDHIVSVDGYASRIRMDWHGMPFGGAKAHQGTISFTEVTTAKLKGHYELHYVSDGEAFIATGEFDVAA